MIIFIDNNEQLPYEFLNIKCDDDCDLKTGSIDTGDYQLSQEDEVTSFDRLEAAENRFKAVVERKSLADLYSTLTQGRGRFVNELKRMVDFGYKAIVVEASWEMILNPNAHLRHPTKATPKSIMASLLAFSQRYNVHVFALPTRALAERFTFRILERWWKDRTPF